MSDSQSIDLAPARKKPRVEPSGWQDSLHNDWTVFHETWWGIDTTNSGQSNATDEQSNAAKLKQCDAIVPVTTSIPIQTIFGIEASGGGILVREESLRFYTRLCELEGTRTKGVIIVGQPGIGKSYFIVYALLRQLAMGRQVLFSTKDGDTYRFNEEGVRWMPKKDVTHKHIPNVDSKGRPAWSLIDADNTPVYIQKVARGVVFAVLATSPQVTRYKEWRKELAGRGKLIIAELWSIQELHKLLSEDGLSNLSATQRARYKTLESVEDLVRDVGPCPRDIIWYIEDRSEYESHVTAAVYEICTVEEVLRLFKQVDVDINTAAHRLILVQPRDNYSMFVSMKTAKIAGMVLEQLQSLRNQAAQNLFLAAATNAETRVLAGQVFEVLAIQYTRGQKPALQPRGFHSMESVEGTVKFPYRFQHTLTTPKCVINVEDHESTLLVANPQEFQISVVSAAFKFLPLAERSLQDYGNFADCALDPTHYYRPKNTKNTLFDSFFLHEGDGNVVVWVFQMTIAKDHDGKTSGFALLEDLVTRVKKKFTPKKVELKYVLVVPYYPDVAVRWHLSPAWVKVPGSEVYVLYLDSFAPFNAFF